ncbi:dTDP-4-dehydrorhamnose reductase [Roseobacter sp. HKCCD5988]|uniref:dTDP-4-dehydrorhamnose reductase n=1 Tax=Roseobacter sp. HKCCD5988 TaxID=3120338 RepID=UPI0030EE663E
MILVLGSTGQVASELKRLPGVFAVGRPDVDFCDLASISEVIERASPLAVINAAAYTAVDAAEDEADVAHRINALASGEVARVCRALDIPIVHISTDYVFDGRGTRPYLPEDACNPLGVYGASKRAGEEAILASGCRHAILRTSWVFSRYGSNFVKTMLRLGGERGQLSVVSDQIGCPTSAASIANCCVEIAKNMIADRSICGTFHFSGAPQVSWFEFAREIFEISGSEVDLTPIATDSYPTKAQRPLYSVLDCQSTRETFGVTQPDWRGDLVRVIKEIGDANV